MSASTTLVTEYMRIYSSVMYSNDFAAPERESIFLYKSIRREFPWMKRIEMEMDDDSLNWALDIVRSPHARACNTPLTLF